MEAVISQCAPGNTKLWFLIVNISTDQCISIYKINCNTKLYLSFKLSLAAVYSLLVVRDSIFLQLYNYMAITWRSETLFSKSF